MFKIVSAQLILRIAAIATAILCVALVLLIRKYWAEDYNAVKIIALAPTSSLLVIFLMTNGWIFRKVWRIVLWVDSDKFPDINGQYEGEISPSKGGEIKIRASVRQSLLHVQIDIYAESSKSATLECTPTIEHGQCKIYYHYRSFPKNIEWQPFAGMTSFDIRRISEATNEMLELSGPYFTDRGTVGRVRLRQTRKTLDGDVSFY